MRKISAYLLSVLVAATGTLVAASSWGDQNGLSSDLNPVRPVQDDRTCLVGHEVYERWLLKRVRCGAGAMDEEIWIAHFDETDGRGAWIRMNPDNDDQLAPNASANHPLTTVGAALGDSSWGGVDGFPEHESMVANLELALHKIGVLPLGLPRSMGSGGTARLEVALADRLEERLIIIDAEPFAPEIDPTFSYFIERCVTCSDSP